MPMIDVYATDRTFADPRALAQELAATLILTSALPFSLASAAAPAQVVGSSKDN
jgi:hypothetical protein